MARGSRGSPRPLAGAAATSPHVQRRSRPTRQRQAPGADESAARPRAPARRCSRRRPRRARGDYCGGRRDRPDDQSALVLRSAAPRERVCAVRAVGDGRGCSNLQRSTRSVGRIGGGTRNGAWSRKGWLVPAAARPASSGGGPWPAGWSTLGGPWLRARHLPLRARHDRRRRRGREPTTRPRRCAGRLVDHRADALAGMPCAARSAPAPDRPRGCVAARGAAVGSGRSPTWAGDAQNLRRGRGRGAAAPEVRALDWRAARRARRAGEPPVAASAADVVYEPTLCPRSPRRCGGLRRSAGAGAACARRCSTRAAPTSCGAARARRAGARPTRTGRPSAAARAEAAKEERRLVAARGGPAAARARRRIDVECPRRERPRDAARGEA